jgi:thiosulfate/3-mercaptopyruvate sulfurtransferase
MIQQGLKIQEVPVKYRNKYFGKSKISDNWKMVFPVGFKILETLFRLINNHKKENLKVILGLLIFIQCNNKTIGIESNMNKIWDLKTSWIVSPTQGVSLNTDKTILIDVRSSTKRFISPLKNSIYLDWIEFSLDTKPDRGKLKNKEDILTILNNKNINRDNTLLIIGDPLDGWGEEGRIVWMFREIDFNNSYIIDGGKKYWDLAMEVPNSKKNPPLKPNKTNVSSYNISALELKEKLNSPNLVVLDTREKREYEGNTPYGETRGGHIPNSKWFYFKDLFDTRGFIKEKQNVESMLSSISVLPSSSIVTYCTGGVRSAMVTAILVSYGIQSRNYSGSMWEWSALKQEDGFLLSK